MRLTRVLKTIVFVLCLVPFLWLIYGAFTGNLGADAPGYIRAATGRWTLQFLLATLAVTPLRQMTGWNAVSRYRRMLGLYAFFYGCWHFITYGLVQGLNSAIILEDIGKRPYITVGLAGFLLMVPLAITSTKKWIGRLGGKRWSLLHRLIYVSAIAGVIHYFSLVKLDTTNPTRYAAVLAILLGFRVWMALRPRFQQTHAIGG